MQELYVVYTGGPKK